MKELYYTPTIEEFHVGFEYEQEPYYFDTRTYGPFENKFLSNIGHAAYVEIELIKNHVRVKYLDRTDIEELGWAFFEEENAAIIYKIKLNLPLELVYDKISKLSRIQSFHPDYSVTFFEGNIKNKSELKKVMQMLQIK